MTNAYLKIVQDGKKLPANYQAMGTSQATLRAKSRDDSEPAGPALEGWYVCQYLYKMNEDGEEWWSSEYSLFVDTDGDFWEVSKSEEYDPRDNPQRRSSLSFHRLNAENFRVMHVNGWDFLKMKNAVDSMV